MLRFFLKKSGSFICSLFIIASLTFFLMKLIPGDPFGEEQALRRDMEEALQRQHGLDRPILEQYGAYLLNLLHGQLGYSFKYPDLTVSNIIAKGFPVSATLGIQAVLTALLFGILLGTFSALRARLGHDRAILISTTVLISVPSFILAALLQYALAIYFPILPLARWGSFAQTILPTLALAAAPMAFISRLVRSGLVEVLRSDYIKLARAKGLPMRLWLWRRAVPNALLPVLSYIGPLIANILVGSFIIEKIFSIPGLGQWLIMSVSNRDYPLIMGLTLFYSFILLLAVFLVDLLYGWWDPRIRLVKGDKQ